MSRESVRDALKRAGLPHGDEDVDRAEALLATGQDVLPRLLQRQETRARRISGRATGFAPEGIKRPSDRDFLREAEPPRPRRRS